ncbi:MAG: translation initiation factor IF-3 [Armatimonadetes bacterium 55-13]|nr:MAG: translation initiation factor IF-3 [Armatimonadetes bacterium 55-13]
MNQRVLKYRDIRVIGSEGQQLGIMQSRQALQMARDEGLDLVMVSPTAQPPVCKIIDYGKHKYLEGKQGKDKKSKQLDVKGIKISPRIAEHDLTFLVKNAIKFLEEGHKVKVTCMFKAREITHPELGRKKLETFADMVKDLAVVERPPSLDGRLMIMVLNPKPNIGSKKNAKAEDKQDSSEKVQNLRDGENSAPQVAQQSPVPAQEGEPKATS